MFQPQSPESLALCARTIPDVATALRPYSVADMPPDQELFDCFLTCLDEALMALATARTHGDFTSIARQAHALKGMGGAAGAAEISVVGERLERAAKSTDMAAASPLIDLLSEWRGAVQTGARGSP